MSVTVYKNLAQVVTLAECLKKDGRRLLPEDLGIIENASVVFDDNQILWVGENNELPEEYKQSKAVDLNGHTLTPEIVDSHTHLVFGGNRAKEYTMRLNGADYEAIGKAGGGILATMQATRKADLDELFQSACQRIERIHSYGIGTIEIKSGYALEVEREIEVSHLIDRLKKKYQGQVQIFNTAMPAHAIDKKFQSSREYLKEVVFPVMEKLAKQKIVDAFDIFHEQGYFDYADTELFFKKCQELAVPVKSHADEFHDNKGALLATQYRALSTDHLLRTEKDGIKALAESNTVATLLPGTGFFLGKEQASARKFLDAGAKVAIGSDYNPGSCHCDNLLLIASLAAPQYKMNIAELWCAITLNAAHALNLKNQGSIVKGLKPRFSLFNVPCVDEITYSWGANFAVPLHNI